MPLDPVTGALIIGGASLLGESATAYGQGRMNKKMRKWNEKMYQLQRQHSLQDWTMQTEYNSPQAQMARLRDAGLNPNLVYGNGATTEAAAVRSSSADSWNPRMPQIDLGSVAGSALGGYYDIQLKEAQTDNLKAQNTVLLNDAVLKAAQAVQANKQAEKTQVDTEKGKLDLNLATDLYQTSIDAAKAALDKVKADTKSTLDENERRAAMQAPNLRIAAETVLKMRAERSRTIAERAKIYQEIRNLQKDERLKQLDIQLKEKGIQPGDPAWMRALTQILLNDGGILDPQAKTMIDPKSNKDLPVGMNPVLDLNRLFK